MNSISTWLVNKIHVVLWLWLWWHSICIPINVLRITTKEKDWSSFDALSAICHRQCNYSILYIHLLSQSVRKLFMSLSIEHGTLCVFCVCNRIHSESAKGDTAIKTILRMLRHTLCGCLCGSCKWSFFCSMDFDAAILNCEIDNPVDWIFVDELVSQCFFYRVSPIKKFHSFIISILLHFWCCFSFSKNEQFSTQFCSHSSPFLTSESERRKRFHLYVFFYTS